MSKPVKNYMSQEYLQSYKELDSACVVSVIGMDAISTNRFRGELRKKNIRLQVVKNSMLRRAFIESTLDPLANALDGPSALVTGGESIIDVAKILTEFQKDFPELQLKMAMMEGDSELIEVSQLAKMKSRMELLADISGLISSPGRKLAGCLASPAGKIAGCLKAMADKEEEAAEAA